MIQTESVAKRHGSVVALEHVTLEIRQGFTAIIGPNGAGKSTLLATIGRLVGADAGTITVGGLDVVTTRSRELARRLAILRQDNHLAIRLSVEDLVGYGRFPHGRSGRTADDRAHVERALDLLDLQPVRRRFLDELSGGQRQRAFVAMALAQNTDHLLLDEPLNNLDPRHAVSLMKLLRRLVAEREMTVVVVMHDINVAGQFADDVVAMRDGRVLHHGPVTEVVTAENLESLYETPAEVVEVGDRRVVLWR
ncbi:MAG: iron ABC transporter ATP-binding protein [Microbacterium sp.]|uniref:iron ABC transporter ATP-binding protein n=1 Tax=unclassified Microbacterium TaxID=2609290 RepID=UPI000C46AB35|nr:MULTISPECIES: ATP-binding cassette domain-containing protein [unclassified Microbacterium]MAB20124.1 iron ABC transporter ATP-binding protein [Microbacterium sp.]MAY48673.1 iron ABC transporter ATP-binding protein [Microbacterium sp.]HAS31868.1 iron ABC transporter ATP-binding protein [Microbacterium sp.]|tara:strand:- start:296 stop:1048 length:753 start_codon:yes stop_codon:yes gene_type:complete